MTGADTPPSPLEPLAGAEWDSAEYAAFGALLGIPGDKVPRAGSGHAADPLNFKVVGLLARNPELARAVLSFNAYLLRGTSLPVRLRELAILRVTHTRQASYLWAEHVRIATEAGVSGVEISLIMKGNDGFAGADRLVLTATDELHADGMIHVATWHSLVDELGTHQAMELIFIVGMWSMLAMAFETWGLTAESD